MTLSATSLAQLIDAPALGRRIDELAAISEAPAPAVTRVLYSEADRRGREYVRGCAREAGLAVREDAVGNLFARWDGSEPRLPAVGTGSHCDAIPNAGRYDGVVGVLGGFAALQALQRAGFRPRRSLEVVMFTAEEPTRFGLGCLGSRLMAGALPLERARALRDPDGRSLDELRAAAGFAGPLEGVRLPDGHYHSFVELHIEQGPLLEKEGIPIGIVEAIAGPSSYRLVLTGEGGHAGAVLMPGRRDASLAAAEIALAVERAALESGSPDTVATTGVWRIEPGAINSVPNRALIEIDLRDTRLDSRERALAAIRRAVAEVSGRRRVEAEFTEINADPPAAADPRTVAIAAEVCDELGLKSRRMVSRAYHDSLFLSRVSPTTMLFIPCRNGWSHRPDEYASPEAITRGVQVLAGVLARLAA
ncbi:MAG TPA: M20 family metallo-hydrolase [Opitutaceae bacterium]|jgi:N-carbamoyl-L-amino-acid hydrolase|nr:M20 family metallo-hydrolase [Opitutaceae bacterium]